MENVVYLKTVSLMTHHGNKAKNGLLHLGVPKEQEIVSSFFDTIGTKKKIRKGRQCKATR